MLFLWTNCRLILGFGNVDQYTGGKWWTTMMTLSNGNIFRVTGPLYGEFAGHRWISIKLDYTTFIALRIDTVVVENIH